ncbi:3-hydroxyacyl-ACP dehydratase FabZ family protein [Streptomyces sp. 3N207]|uniref:3-hydroxyacyl-ACP dehydratase FabZ family protein n=1 Tax=Streptomyces sp. 3N207 TaxID=3457417 RepID=UPI003FD0CD3A
MPRLPGHPVAGTVEVGTASGGTRHVHLTVSPEEPVFAGHYPGFPVFPGVCLLDFVYRGGLAVVPEPERTWRLDAVEKARFFKPVLPGDRLTADLSWQRCQEGWRCAAEVSTASGTVARIRIRLREGRST